ncbi:heterokaryon incompatibility protein-domain-containing protein, partial [Phascolomyces articulosus]
MYITYEAAQWVWTDWFGDSQNRKIFKQNKPPEIVPNRLPKPDFMPSKLVRTYDMKVVPGSQVNEGYCTISYSWNQSGEVDYSNKEKATRTDEGKHKIIYIDQKIRRRGKKNKRILYKVRYVKFEGLIQQICRQFNINYVWYDQMCINQEDKEEKKREIRNMHRVYGNAHCLVALVPEYHVTYLDKHLYKKKQYRLNFEASCDDNDSIHFRCYGSARFALSFALQNIQTSEWCKRLWTLEESLKSKTLLFIGQNTHLYAKNDNS